MPATLPILLGERSVTVRELTVGEVRDRLQVIECGSAVDAVSALALEECTLDDLAVMTDLGVGDFNAYGPSELKDVIAAAKKMNPLFFRARAALYGVAQLLGSPPQT